MRRRRCFEEILNTTEEATDISKRKKWREKNENGANRLESIILLVERTQCLA